MNRVRLDTNVLLRLFASSDPKHPTASDAVAGALRGGHLPCLAAQVVMKSWVVLTRPIEVNGFGWSVADARDVLGQAMGHFPLLPETPDVFDVWWDLVGGGVSGKRSHDARLAALMRVHGVRHLLTFNRGDFAQLPGIVAIEPGQEITD